MTTMLPARLMPESFRSYPPQAQSLCIAHLNLLRQLPLIMVPLLLSEAIAYDWRFPSERNELEEQLAYLSELSKPQLNSLLEGLSRLRLSSDLPGSSWVDSPNIFLERLTAHLWATDQMESFRSAAEEYAAAWRRAKPSVEAPMKRLGIVVVGQGVAATGYPLFRKLRPRGVYFSNVSGEDGMRLLLAEVAARAAAYPVRYGHWYIDGGTPESASPALTSISYAALQPARTILLNHVQSAIQSGSAGPEALRTQMAQTRPQDVGLPADGPAAVLGHFQLSLLTEGSGTQIFSTTFVQWAARETLRRAQPVTLLLRFAPRQRQQSMNELLSSQHTSTEFDAEGSLIDADMAAYYTWLNQQRLSGASQAGFLAWFEEHGQAVAIGPSLPRGTVSTSPTTLQQILTWLS
jgi:hypothetical protein